MKLPKPRPIPMRERASIIFVERGQLDVVDGAFVVIDATGVRTQLPIAGITCVMLASMPPANPFLLAAIISCFKRGQPCILKVASAS